MAVPKVVRSNAGDFNFHPTNSLGPDSNISCRAMVIQREWSIQSSDPYQAAPLESECHMQKDNDKSNGYLPPSFIWTDCQGGRGACEI